MRATLKALSICGLLLTVVPAALVAGRVLSWNTHTLLMLVGAAIWFASAPAWIRSKKP